MVARFIFSSFRMGKRKRRSGASRTSIDTSNRLSNSPRDPPKRGRRQENNTSFDAQNVFSSLAELDEAESNAFSNTGISGDATAINHSDIGDFGGSVTNAAVNLTKVKLPPLVVKAVPLNKLVKDFASQGISAEYKLLSIGTRVVFSVKQHYDLAVTYLKNSKAEFFSHDNPGEKPFKAVIRGLPNFDPKEVEMEIKDRFKLVPTAVYRMTRRDEKSKKFADCLFLVHFKKGTVTLNALQAIRSIFSIIVRWEPYRGGRRDLTQCQRCLNFGHGTRHCNMKPRCGYCAGEHFTSKCSVEGAIEYKCANCGGPHQGSDRGCPKRELHASSLMK